MIKWLAKWVKFPQHILEVVSCYIFSSTSRCQNWWGRASSPSCLLYAVLAILPVSLKDIPWRTASDITVVTVKKCATSIKHVYVFCDGFKRRCYSVMTHTKYNATHIPHRCTLYLIARTYHAIFTSMYSYVSFISRARSCLMTRHDHARQCSIRCTILYFFNWDFTLHHGTVRPLSTPQYSFISPLPTETPRKQTRL